MPQTINCKGQLIDISSPKIMGILNITPNSFFDGGKYKNESDILAQVEKMLSHGASFIDVGAYSSKPNSPFVSETEELGRIIPIINLLIKYFPEIIISVDTFRSRIAKTSIQNGASIINDITGGLRDKDMLKTIAELQVPYIMMHMKGDQNTMQSLTNYDDLVNDIIFYFSQQIEACLRFGITDIIIDPGFGFAKTRKQNFELLNKLELLKIIDKPILAGVSRKSMIYKTLNTSAKEALNGTTALHMIALQKGANILRVHDVKEAAECIALFKELQ